MIGRIGPVSDVQDTGAVTANVFRSPLIPSIDTNALSVDAASLGFPEPSGRRSPREFPQRRDATEPVCVLGAAAAQRLGIDRVFPGERIWLNDMWFYVAGILNRRRYHPRDRLRGARRLQGGGEVPRLQRLPERDLREGRADL